MLGLVLAPAGASGQSTDDVLDRRPLHAPVVTGDGALAADQPASMAVGNAVLAEGGDAIDAAVATALALGVENPSSSGLGGGGFALVWRAAEHRLYALDFRETAPGQADPSRYLLPDGSVHPFASKAGCLAAAVPSELAGLVALHRRFGKEPWADLVAPAETLATDGVAVTPYLAKASHAMARYLPEFPDAATAYLDAKGQPLRTGATRKDPALAETLGTIAVDPADFYHGAIAAHIAATCADTEGAITTSDLATYRVRWRPPVVGEIGRYRVASMPPPSSGGTVLVEILNIIEPYQPQDLDPQSTEYTHLLAEAMKHAFRDRSDFYGDPDFVGVPVDWLTSRRYAAELRARIDPVRTHEPETYGARGLQEGALQVLSDDSGTSHISVIDRHGNAVALTTSVNLLFGSMVRVPRVGIVLNDTMDDFSLAPGSANEFGLVQSELNAIEPNKRPLSSMSPLLVIDEENRAVWVAGASGGPRIITGTLQVTLNHLVHGMGIAEAIQAPRIHDQWLPNQVFVEPSLSAKVRQGLESRGHVLKTIDAVGNVQAAGLDDEGHVQAAPDPRKY